jgi:hypothetical protein
MNTTRVLPTLLLAAAVALAPLRSARADEATSDIAFSDPAKPGTLKIRVFHGDITVHGGDVKQISVKSEANQAGPTPRKDGLRVLSASAGFTLSEKDNVAVLEYGSDGWTGGSADFDITVPRTTSVIVANSTHGAFECSGISGDVDVRTLSGDVKLDDISGGALVETMNGEIDVGIKAVTDKHPLSFTSMRGQISIRVPSDTKANVRFRTHRGVILTNFDDKTLVTKTEVLHKKEKEKLHPVPAEAAERAEPAEPAEPAEAAEKSGDSDGDWHADVRDSIRDAARDAAEAARDAAEAIKESMDEVHIEMSHGNYTLPPMTGGKVVAGTLNGGGVELQAASMSGDIILRKADGAPSGEK